MAPNATWYVFFIRIPWVVALSSVPINMANALEPRPVSYVGFMVIPHGALDFARDWDLFSNRD